MAGTRTAMEESFGSTCHGAGRVLSRTAARKRSRGRAIHRELADKGILVKWTAAAAANVLGRGDARGLQGY